MKQAAEDLSYWDRTAAPVSIKITEEQFSNSDQVFLSPGV